MIWELWEAGWGEILRLILLAKVTSPVGFIRME